MCKRTLQYNNLKTGGWVHIKQKTETLECVTTIDSSYKYKTERQNHQHRLAIS